MKEGRTIEREGVQKKGKCKRVFFSLFLQRGWDFPTLFDVARSSNHVNTLSYVFGRGSRRHLLCVPVCLVFRRISVCVSSSPKIRRSKFSIVWNYTTILCVWLTQTVEPPPPPNKVIDSIVVLLPTSWIDGGDSFVPQSFRFVFRFGYFSLVRLLLTTRRN